MSVHGNYQPVVDTFCKWYEIKRFCFDSGEDDSEAYETVIPAKWHRAVGKDSGLTSYIERFNNTLRQRVSRLVRKTLSFSKKVENHVGAIWNFIHEYNRLIREKRVEQEPNTIFSILY